VAVENIYPPDFPFQPKFIQLEGHRIAYFDEGHGDKTILFLHGNPVAAHVYTPLILLLRVQFRCIAPDLLGFGMSDKPALESDYSLQGHIDIIGQFVSELDLHNVLLVVHDWGGPVGLATAAQEKHRYTHLVVLNTLTEPIMRIPNPYKIPFHILRRTDRLATLIIKRLGLFQRIGVAIMDPQDQEIYFRANHSPATRAAIAAFPKMIPFSSEHPTYPLLRSILDHVLAWDIPTLVIFSDHDSVFAPEDGRRFAANLKNARYKTIHGPKHFLQYEKPQEIATELSAFSRQLKADT
jgi:haloalkane dehalogenase